MDFELTTEQEMLRDTVRDVLSRNYTPERRSDVVAGESGWDEKVWATFAEADGGMGAGPIETMLVLEEIGRGLAPEPLLNCAVLPGELIGKVGSPAQRAELLPRIAAGKLLMAFAHGEPGRRWPDVTISTRATRSAGEWCIRDCADHLRLLTGQVAKYEMAEI